jgi:hypothetical protein
MLNPVRMVKFGFMGVLTSFTSGAKCSPSMFLAEVQPAAFLSTVRLSAAYIT